MQFTTTDTVETVLMDATLDLAGHATAVGDQLEQLTGLSAAGPEDAAFFWVGRGPLVDALGDAGTVVDPLAFIGMLHRACQQVQGLPAEPTDGTLPRRLGWLLVIDDLLDAHLTETGRQLLGR